MRKAPESDGVRLFVDRALAATAGFRDDDPGALVEVCRRLDGLPLAIEMAAARMRTMSLRELVSRLDTRLDLLRSPRRSAEPHHRTLREVVAWSFDLLSGAERRLLERAAVFAGDISIDAAQDVAGWGELDPSEVPRLLTSLADRSMLVAVRGDGPTSYRMLDTIARFAAERLGAAGGHGTAVARHAGYHARLAEAADAGLRTPDEARWAAVVRRAVDDLAAAHRRSVAAGLVDEAVRIVAGLHLFVYERLRADIAAWAEPTLRMPGASGHPLLPVVRTVAALGELQAGRLDRGASLAAEAIDESRGSPIGRLAHHVLGDIAIYQGDLDLCDRHAVAGIHLSDRAGDPYWATVLLGDRCLVRAYRGEIDDALGFAAAHRRGAEAVGAPSLLVMSDFVEGETLLDTDPSRAQTLLDRAAAEADAVGSAFISGVALLSATTVRARYGDAGEAVTAFRHAINHWWRLGDWTHQRTTLRNYVVLLARLGADEAAVRVLGALSIDGGEVFGAEVQRVEDARTDLARRLGAGVYRDAFDAGRRLSRDELIGFALETADHLTPGPAREAIAPAGTLE